MNKIMTYETLGNFAYVNDQNCKKPIRGIVISFFGLGCTAMYSEDNEEAAYYAENGIIYVFPYNNPWCWMNPQAIAYTDEIIDVLFEKYGFSEDLPIVVNGGSMGGHSSLVYTRYAKRTPVCCIANCPVCDLPYHYTERPDLPRTIYSAFCKEEGALNDVLKKFSPVHLADTMPSVTYHIFHCDKDQAVNINKHSDLFIANMKAAGKDISYYIVKDKDHCDLTPEMYALYKELAVKAIIGQ